jgi:carnosine N-methyltransferase
MCAGDFMEVYGAPEQTAQWDAVATCFFIDTAHNVVEYLEVIARCLKPGGVWVNFGPLLFHWADGEEMSVAGWC